MKRGRNEDPEQDVAKFDYYLPGMPRLSAAPGRFERFVSRLFRRRGGLRAVVRTDER